MADQQSDDSGDRSLRRRHRLTLLAVGGAALAVAMIVISITVLADGDEGARPEVTMNDGEVTAGAHEKCDTDEPTTVPDALHFPLDEGLDIDADSSIEGPGPEVGGIRLPREFCGSGAWPPANPVARLAVRVTGPEFSRVRELVSFADAEEAVAAVAALRSAVEQCPEVAGDEPADDEFYVSHRIVSGYDDATFSSTYREGVGGGVYQFVRVGHAVLATVWGGEWSADTAPRGARLLDDENRELTPLMCEFTQAGCLSTDDPAAERISDGFPLSRGWPEQTEGPNWGLTGPKRRLPAIELTACEGVLEERPYVDRLRAHWENPADYRDRQLTLYRTIDSAADVLTGVVELYRACPQTEPDELGQYGVYEVRRTAEGDESWLFIRTEERDGYPATSALTLWHVIRVGPAVLILSDSNEGGAAPEGTLPRFIDTQVDEGSAVIDAMCEFTEAGC